MARARAGDEASLTEADSAKARLTQATQAGRTEGVILRRESNWSNLTVTLVQTAIVIVLLGLWEIGVRLGFINHFFWSKPTDIISTGYVFFSKGTALQDTWFTFRATVIGFVTGSLLGAAIGLSLWWSTNAARVVEPFIIVFNAMPKMALGPLIILMFGIGIASKIALAIALTFVITALAAYSGVKAVDQDLVKLTYSLGGRRRDIFFKVILPSTMPWIISSFRINIGLALAGVLIGEFISSQFGLGKVILYAGSTYDIALIWSGIIVLSILSLMLYAVVVWLEKYLLMSMQTSSNSGSSPVRQKKTKSDARPKPKPTE